MHDTVHNTLVERLADGERHNIGDLLHNVWKALREQGFGNPMGESEEDETLRFDAATEVYDFLAWAEDEEGRPLYLLFNRAEETYVQKRESAPTDGRRQSWSRPPHLTKAFVRAYAKRHGTPSVSRRN